MLFKQVLADLKEKKRLKLTGAHNGIPFPHERFREYIPDIEPGSYIGVLGASGVGKSKFTRNTFLYHPLNFSMENDYPVKIIYFALEDPKKKIYKNLISHYLCMRHKYTISLTKLESKGEFILPDQAEKLIEQDQEFFEWVDKNVLIIDDCVTPDSIEKACDKLKERIPAGEHVIVIIDNYANLVPDDNKKDWDAVRYFSRNLVRLKFCKEYGWTVIGVLQEDIETEKNRFRSIAGGRTSIGSLEPNGSSIGNAKIVVQDLFYGLGIFNPWKYELLRYPNNKGYDIDILRNNFRGINIFKNNEGDVGGRLGLFFDKCEVFRQMPMTTDEMMLDKIYKKVMEEEKLRIEKFAQKKLF
jgi:KaiC/GvpD/RAD55 family RecA-like ATPase